MKRYLISVKQELLISTKVLTVSGSPVITFLYTQQLPSSHLCKHSALGAPTKSLSLLDRQNLLYLKDHVGATQAVLGTFILSLD